MGKLEGTEEGRGRRTEAVVRAAVKQQREEDNSEVSAKRHKSDTNCGKDELPADLRPGSSADEEMGAGNLDDALENVPGLHVVPTNIKRINYT